MGSRTAPVPTLRDAALRAAPQDEAVDDRSQENFASGARAARDASFGVLDQHFVGFAQEKAMADHAGQTVEARAQPHDIETGGGGGLDHPGSLFGVLGGSRGL